MMHLSDEAYLNRPRPVPAKRFYLLGGPRGELNCLPAGSILLQDSRYRQWTILLKINRPLTIARVRYAEQWGVDVFRC